MTEVTESMRRSGGTVMLGQIRRMVTLTLDGVEVRVPEGTTILEALKAQGTETPTLCYAPNL
ncbi:MAG: NADP-reducing hydrogenase subunit HndD, partial [Pseudonocardiales bacterium]|nr:NADP-reducing hydrogenase subunit HndD [Pseudonocardiales bacterium]